MPGAVISNGVTPKTRGVNTIEAKQRVTLVLPIDRALDAGDPLVWLITWK